MKPTAPDPLGVPVGHGTKGDILVVPDKPGVGMINLCLSLLAIASVLAFGGVYATSLFLMQTAVGLLAAWTLLRFGWPGIPRAALAVIVFLLAIPLVQMVPLWNRIVAAVSPARAVIEQEVLSPAVGSSKFLTLSVNPHATRVATLLLVCYVLVFLLGFFVYITRRGQPALVPVLIGLGCFEAVYGIVQYLTGWQYIFTYAKREHTLEATGTYFNRNHFAGFLEMVLPFVLATILFRIPTSRNKRRPRWVQILSSSSTSQSLRDMILFTIMCVALIFSRSRMGIAAAMVGMLLVVAIAALQGGRRSALVIALLALALPAAYSIWIGLAPVLERFGSVGIPELLEQDRLPIWRDTLALIGDYPLLGTGLGTYHWASLRYQTHKMDLRYDHAHNDYLEFAADIGVPAAVLLFGSLWILVAKVARRSPILERTRDRILAAGCAGAMAALLTHTLTDFNLQIPANAFLFAWIAGTATALVRSAPQAR